jgi:hypothetical protein
MVQRVKPLVPRRMKTTSGPHAKGRIKVRKIVANGPDKSGKKPRTGGNRKYRSQMSASGRYTLPVDENTDFKGRYYFDDLTPGVSETTPLLVNPDASGVHPLSTLEVYDNPSTTSNLVIEGKTTLFTKPVFVIAKISKRQTNEMKGSWKQHRATLSSMIKAKNSIARGVSCASQCSKYILSGHRKDPLGTKVTEYTYKQSTTQPLREELTQAMSDFVGTFEPIGARIIPPDDRVTFKSLQETVGIPKLSSASTGYGTQIAMGVDYWSSVHIDDDCFYSTLTCISLRNTNPGVVLHYFLFPSVGVAVPIREGDVLVFNPLLPHGVTNATESGTVLCSLYVSGKTVDTQAAAKPVAKFD